MSKKNISAYFFLACAAYCSYVHEKWSPKVCWESVTFGSVDLQGTIQLSLVPPADLHLITVSCRGVEVTNLNQWTMQATIEINTSRCEGSSVVFRAVSHERRGVG